MRELEHGAHGETRRPGESKLQRGRDEVLLLLHLVEVARARVACLVPEPVEAQHIDPRRAHAKRHDNGRHDAAELARELGAIGPCGRRISRAHSHVRVVREPPKVVPSAVNARAYPQPDVRRIPEPRQWHPAGTPIARATERRRVAWRLVVVASIHGRPGPHHEAVAPTIVVEPCRPGARGIGQLVVSPATNHANQRSRSVDAAHDEPVVPTVQVQADLLGLPAVECPLVERCLPRARRQTHGHSTSRKAFDLRDVAVVGTVDLHDAGQERVVAVAHLR